MRKKGFILVYMFILIIPILLVCGTLLNIVLLDYKTSVNVSKKQQASNNAEAGRFDAIRRIETIDFTKKTYVTYCLHFEDGIVIYSNVPVESNDCVVVSIQSNLSIVPPNYTIKTASNHMGYTCIEEITYYK
jgi:hypothetical protein